jgi:integrase
MSAVLSIAASSKFWRRPVSQNQPLTLSGFLEDYARGHIAHLAAPSQAKYAFHIRKHIGPDLGALPMAEITPRLLDQWLAGKKQAGLSWAYRNDLKGIVSGLFTVAKKWGLWTGDNPARYVSIGRKRAVREKRKLTAGETRALLAALPGDVAIIVMLGLFCTLRISEILGLRWKHIDFNAGIVRVRQRYYRGDLDQTKTEGSERDVPLGGLAEELRRLRPPTPGDEYVFRVRTRRGFTRDDRTILRAFLRPAAKRLGLYWPGFGFHSFRREAITGITAGADVIQAMRAAGHTRVDTTLLYGLRDLERQEAAIRRMQGLILGKEKAA